MTSTQANHYVVTGDGISGTINTSGINGQPVIELEIDGAPLPDPELRDVTLGIQVSGVVSTIPDLETVKATILVPHVNVGGIADPTSVVRRGRPAHDDPDVDRRTAPGRRTPRVVLPAPPGRQRPSGRLLIPCGRPVSPRAPVSRAAQPTTAGISYLCRRGSAWPAGIRSTVLRVSPRRAGAGGGLSDGLNRAVSRTAGPRARPRRTVEPPPGPGGVTRTRR